ncbi:MAG: hypothetical protein Q4Q58_03850 [Thermoplasmata archaeon]|nr:hypothetical protein [Thermoplasmata archaeon]
MASTDSVKRFLAHPAVLVAIAAIVVRLVLMPLLTYDYDIYHWAQIIENFQTGDGLYDIDAYYYTPTWGYLLGFISLVMDAFLNVGDFGIRFVELLPVEDLAFRFHTATTVTLSFAVCMKIPIMLADLATGYLLYRFIRDEFGSERKALFGLILWLFCPTLIYMSGVQAQFDSFSALFMMLTFVLIRNDRNLLAGMTFAAGVMLKFFPAFTVIVLVAYVLVKHRADGTGLRRVAASVIGASLVTLVMYIPIIMSGDVATSLSFVTGRAGDMQEVLLVAIGNYIVIAIAVAGMLAFGWLMHRSSPEDADRNLLVYTFLALSAAMFMSATPQYMLVMLPFMIMVMMGCDGRMRLPYILICAGSIISALANNNVLLLDGASAYLGLVSADWINSVAEALHTFVGSQTYMGYVCNVGQVLEYIGFILIPLIWYDKVVERYSPRLAAGLRGLKRWDVE